MKEILTKVMLTIILFMATWHSVGAESKTVELPSNGVYVFDLNGDFYSFDSWDAQNNDKVVGIALITNHTKALIALRNANTNGKVVWGPDGLVDGVVSTEPNYSNNTPGKALSDYNGSSNTQKEVRQLMPQNNTALYLASSYMFPNNSKGYLPALGELVDMFENMESVNNLLEKVNGEKIKNDWYWSSTQHYLRYRMWECKGVDGWFAELRNENSPLTETYGVFYRDVRPFGTIPQTIEIDDVDDEIVWEEYISKSNGCVINTDIYPTQNTKFEIKMDFGTNPDFWMGCWDLTNGSNRVVSRLFIYQNKLCYDFPDDWGSSGRTSCTLDLSESKPHVIQFGNKYLYDLTTGYKKTGSAVSNFSVKAPFGLYGLIEYAGENKPLVYKPHTDSEIKIYYFKVYQGDELIADMRPARDEDGLLCMYDVVRKRYFYCLNSSGNKIFDDVVPKCAKPTIRYANGKLTYTCETEGVTFKYDIVDNDIQSGSGNEVQLSVTYFISVYATKAGYRDSEVATGTLCWIDQQPSTEGIIAEDAVTEVKALPVLIQSNGGTITVQGVNEGTEVFVYSVNGLKQGSAIATQGMAIINTSLQPGTVAIVKIGERSVRVAVN